MSNVPATTRGRRRVGRAFTLVVTAFVATAALVVPAAAEPPTSPGDGPHVGATVPDAWPGNSPNQHGGTDYYVDATGGDDDNSGTSQDAAWQTLAKVNETTFEPGDRILLKAGEEWHDQQLWPKGDGTADAPISIDAYGESGERRPYIAANGTTPHPFIGEETTSGPTDRTPPKDPETVGTTGAVVLRNQQGWEIANLELSNDDDFDTDITTGQVVRDGVSITINADLLEDGDDTIMEYFRISDLYVHNVDGPSTWQSIHYGGVVFQVFGNERYTAYDTGGYYFEDVRIENNTFEDVELHAVQLAFNWFDDRTWEAGYTDETGKYHEGWEQYWVRDRDLYTRDVYIGHNYAVGTGQGAIQLANTKDMTVEYNEINGFLERYTQVSAGLYLWAGADTVMQFNEVYDGPYDEYDATPWDLEYTNFDVTYQYNYSHDNAGGWMAYMGNSSNSIARYNLSVNDNGVLVKNMLSTNYSPSYFLNNVFVYDGDELDSFHDETFLSTVYFMNNVFYNTSETTTTPWYRTDGALRQAVFSNNAYFEASGEHSEQQPQDANAVLGQDPGFVADVTEYERYNGVRNVRDSASVFQLAADSPLVDAGRYNERLGEEDFFGTPIYYGEAPDIGLHEVQQGRQVENPVDENPIEEEDGGDRVNLALDKPITASSTHPHQDFALHAGNLVDGDTTTRWAAADDAEYPIAVEIDFEEEVTFDEIYLDEHTDSGTEPRVLDFALQRFDIDAGDDGEWITFYQGSEGIGHDLTATDFGEVTSTRLRLLLESSYPGQMWAPTMTEIQVYHSGQVPGDAAPALMETTGLYDLADQARELVNNSVSYGVDHDGAELRSIRYVGTEGNVLGSLDEGADYGVDSDGDAMRYTLTSDFLSSRQPGVSGLQFEYIGADAVRADLVVVDSTALVSELRRAETIEPADSEEYAELAAVIADVQDVLSATNRDVPGTGNEAVAQTDLDSAAAGLRAAVDTYLASATDPTDPSEPSDPSVPADPTDPSVPVDPADPSVPADSSELSDPERDGLPSTGVTVVAAMVALVLLVSGAVMFVLRRSATVE